MPRTLVIQLARFGDLLQSARLLRTLAADGANAVHLCLDRSLEPLARLVFPHVTVHALTAHGVAPATTAAFLAANRGTLHELAGYEFSAVYNLNFSGLNFALSALFPAERVRGYRMQDGQPLKDAWTDLAFRWTRHRASSPINLVDYWAALAPSPVAPEAVNPPARPGGRGVGVALAGRNARRSLPPEVLAPVVHAVAKGIGAKKVWLLGSKAERPLARALLKYANRELLDATTDLSGATDWAGLINALTGLDVLITPDTGAMHLACHLGTPVLALFLASAWAWETGPYGRGHRVWQAVHECTPCVESRPCDCGLRCLLPFRERAFLRALTRPDQPGSVPGLLGLVGDTDALGVIYRATSGQDPRAEERAGLRGLLAAHLGMTGALVGSDPTSTVGPAQSLLHERDWLLQNERTEQRID